MDRKSIDLAPARASVALGEPHIAVSEKPDSRMSQFASFNRWLSANDDANLYKLVALATLVGFALAAFFREVAHV